MLKAEIEMVQEMIKDAVSPLKRRIEQLEKVTKPEPAAKETPAAKPKGKK